MMSLRLGCALPFRGCLAFASHLVKTNWGLPSKKRIKWLQAIKTIHSYSPNQPIIGGKCHLHLQPLRSDRAVLRHPFGNSIVKLWVRAGDIKLLDWHMIQQELRVVGVYLMVRWVILIYPVRELLFDLFSAFAADSEACLFNPLPNCDFTIQIARLRLNGWFFKEKGSTPSDVQTPDPILYVYIVYSLCAFLVADLLQSPWTCEARIALFTRIQT